MGKLQHKIIKVHTESFRAEPFERSVNELVSALNDGWHIVTATQAGQYAVYIVAIEATE